MAPSKTISSSLPPPSNRKPLAYDDVSDWLEGRGSWQPDSEAIAQQITLLKDVCQRRSEWRQTHALVFKDRPDYRFVLGEKAKCWISSRNRVALPTALSKSR